VSLEAKKQMWYLDNGCSKHMTGDAFTWSTSNGNMMTMSHEDNNQGKILGSGDIGGKDTMIIKDVLLVDGLKLSLLSISQLCDKGYKITFEPDLCLIAYSTSRETVLVVKE